MGPSNMEWFEEVSLKYKRKNQILFSKECELFQDLSYIIKHQNRRTMVMGVEFGRGICLCLGRKVS